MIGIDIVALISASLPNPHSGHVFNVVHGKDMIDSIDLYNETVHLETGRNTEAA